MIYLDDKMVEWKERIDTFFKTPVPRYADLGVIINKYLLNRIELQVADGGLNLTLEERMYIYERVAAYDAEIALRLKETAFCFQVLRLMGDYDLEMWASAHLVDGKGFAAALIADTDDNPVYLKDTIFNTKDGQKTAWVANGCKIKTYAYEYSNLCVFRAFSERGRCYIVCPTSKLQEDNGRILIHNLVIDDFCIYWPNPFTARSLNNYDLLVSAAIRTGIARLVRFEIAKSITDEQYMQIENKIIICELLIQNIIDMMGLDDDYSVEAGILRVESCKLIALVEDIADGRSNELTALYELVENDIHIGSDWLYDDENIFDGSFESTE